VSSAAEKSPSEPDPAPRKRGPIGALPDPELLAAIRQVIAESPFVGEGHRKVWARLRRQGVGTARKRVLGLMREAGLLAPTPQVRGRAKRLHEARITVSVPDTLWATDATESSTDSDGRCAVFAMIDPACGEVWVDATPRMDRWAAADLLREACKERFGSVEAAVADGLALRHDGRAVLLLRPLPGRDRPPRDQPLAGVSLRARDQRLRREVHQTLKEQVLWIERFETLAAARCDPRVRAALQPRVAARSPRLPHPARSPPAPDRSGRAGMINNTNHVSGYPGAPQSDAPEGADRLRVAEERLTTRDSGAGQARRDHP
jgi:putative transposase